MLTTQQETTLAAAIRAEPSIAAAVSIRNDVAIAAWVNSAHASIKAWNPSLSQADLFDATNITKFDNLTAGKRDAWHLMLTNAPLDMTRNKLRTAVVDIWGASDSVAVLTDCTRAATNGEAALGGSDFTTNTVTAKELTYAGNISITDVSLALNRNP